ncbi:DUF883 family protein [Rhizobium paknamense]|uniref:ElaB/YqjD/DUF883 family membrane-anchored ribosome-binding protein n=1 Tax=Rhizobium paknamense TaxID=1206817 RepID=A0ABU0IGH0_9HYPH|nr:hypothetical protein [Rhizobium paknamense]MDQ0456309.1 ElaB/YqjD/DUF883 family membrane-anchored ribosome-binding protein [Rhizobium paknamense]
MVDPHNSGFTDNLNDAEAKAASLELEAQIEQLKRDIAGLTKSLADLGSAKLNQAASKASQLKDDVAEASADALNSARGTVAAVERDLEDHIRQKPLQSIAIAAGLGFLLALISRR